jgi:hypothetical protein
MRRIEKIEQVIEKNFLLIKDIILTKKVEKLERDVEKL